MPELPEVEIIKQSLKKAILSKIILKVSINNKNLRFKLSPSFKKNIENKKITNIYRYAKYLIIELNKKTFLTIHFGMSGTLHLVKKNCNISRTNLSFYQSKILPKKHNHVKFIFNNFEIYYNDPRRFGYMFIFKSSNDLWNFLKKNGLEPLEREFNLKYLREKFQSRNKNIKNILLDQSIISGIGNIYASEILFYSGINPFRSGKDLKTSELKKIIKFSKFVLNKAIRYGGSTIRDFKNAQNKVGKYQNEFKVYNRKNLICNNYKCNFRIVRTQITNRSTFFCKNCQK